MGQWNEWGGSMVSNRVSWLCCLGTASWWRSRKSPRAVSIQTAKDRGNWLRGSVQVLNSALQCKIVAVGNMPLSGL